MSLPKRRKQASASQTGEAVQGITAVMLQEQQPAGTNAGNPVEDAWTERTLNTVVNPMGVTWIGLASNKFTLAPGRYRVRGSCPFSNRDTTDNSSRLRIKNVTDNSVAILGRSGQFNGLSGLDRNEYTEVVGYISISTTKTFSLEYYLKDDAGNGAGYGLGSPFNIGGDAEIYATVEIERLGD